MLNQPADFVLTTAITTFALKTKGHLVAFLGCNFFYAIYSNFWTKEKATIATIVATTPKANQGVILVSMI